MISPSLYSFCFYSPKKPFAPPVAVRRPGSSPSAVSVAPSVAQIAGAHPRRNGRPESSPARAGPGKYPTRISFLQATVATAPPPSAVSRALPAGPALGAHLRRRLPAVGRAITGQFRLGQAKNQALWAWAVPLAVCVADLLVPAVRCRSSYHPRLAR